MSAGPATTPERHADAERRAGEGVDHRSGRRRRGAELTSAIHDAVLAELAEGGFAGLTMDAVAARARTGKASLYRRWPTRVELVMDVVYAALPGEQLADTGTFRGDVVAMLETVVASLSGPIGEALRGLRGAALLDPELGRRIRDHSRDAALENLRELVARGVRRGELDPAHATPLRLEAAPAILRNHFLFHDHDELDVAALVDEVVLPLLGPARRPG